MSAAHVVPQQHPWLVSSPGKLMSVLKTLNLKVLCSDVPQCPILVVTKLCWVLFRPHCTKPILCSGQKHQEDFFLSPSGFCLVKPQSNYTYTHIPMAGYLLSFHGSPQGPTEELIPDVDPWLTSPSHTLSTQSSHEPLLMQANISRADPTVLSRQTE